MIYQVDRVVRDVRVCIDENSEATSFFQEGDEETLRLNEVVRAKVVDAVERVHREAPYMLLEDVAKVFQSPSDTVYWQDQGSGHVLLPDDYMRLLVFEMSDWERAVYEPISTADPAYKKQRSRVKALRGVPQRPVCAVGLRPEGLVLEFYSCKDRTATIARAMYVAVPKVESVSGVDSIEAAEQCYTAVVYTCAGLTLAACGEGEKAKYMFELAKTEITR